MTALQSKVTTISWQISAVKQIITMAFRRQITGVTIHCNGCHMELAKGEMLMLATTSKLHHLAVRPEKKQTHLKNSTRWKIQRLKKALKNALTKLFAGDVERAWENLQYYLQNSFSAIK